MYHVLGVGPANPISEPSGKLGSGTVAVTLGGGNANVAVEPTNEDARTGVPPQAAADAKGIAPRRQSPVLRDMISRVRRSAAGVEGSVSCHHMVAPLWYLCKECRRTMA